MAANSPLGPRFARENAPDSGITYPSGERPFLRPSRKYSDQDERANVLPPGDVNARVNDVLFHLSLFQACTVAAGIEPRSPVRTRSTRTSRSPTRRSSAPRSHRLGLGRRYSGRRRRAHSTPGVRSRKRWADSRSTSPLPARLPALAPRTAMSLWNSRRTRQFRQFHPLLRSTGSLQGPWGDWLS